MRPELIHHLLNFTPDTWVVIAYLGSIGLGVYNGLLAWRQGGPSDKARGRVFVTALTWALGGIAATRFFLTPFLYSKAVEEGGHVDLPLHTYGLAIAIGFIVAINLSAHEASRSGIYPGETPPLDEAARNRVRNTVFDLAFWVLIAAIVGSRVMFIIVNWGGPEGYAAHPENILKFWTGGLVFYGGLLGSMAASLIYARKHRFSFIRLADAAMPTISIGHFFGRLGCFAAGCCFGRSAAPGFPFGVKFPPGSLAYDTLLNQRHVLTAAAETTPPLYPTQLFDSTGELLIYFILVGVIRPRQRFTGQVMLAWLVLYPLLRITDEFFRGDTERGIYTSLQISVGQMTSIALALAAVVMFFRLRPKTTEPAPA
jgi:phosphatidylglycerol:prolipoprotein diacylglycerol transferase